ncbi:MAG TPA: cytochrome C oxidase subunit IV family protein [Verrucomicrobiae bacterium]|nr:cytochrome C oxidase subunit IV family protein [Verrucomicrobiae bacterium]
MNDTHHADVESHVGTYIKVFVALAVGTLVTVLASNLHLGIILGIIVALIIATVKGSLVAGFFMHLVAEKKAIYWVLILTATFVVAMVGLIMFSHEDQQGRQQGIFAVPAAHVQVPQEGQPTGGHSE